MNAVINQTNDIKSLVNGKKVVLVGPAPYLEGLGRGSIFDGYDTVVRVNRGYDLTKDPDSYGSRIDILYHCGSQKLIDGGPITDEMYTKMKALRLSIPYLNKEDSISFPYGYEPPGFENFTLKLSEVDKAFYLNEEKRLGCRPNVGFSAISDLLQNYKPKELYITGITLFKGGYSTLYRTTTNDETGQEEQITAKYQLDLMVGANFQLRHDQYLTLKYMRDLYNDYKQILKLDTELEEILAFDLETYKQGNHLETFNDEQVFNHYLSQPE